MYNILVVDDVLINRILIKELLKENKNINIIESDNGKDAIDKFMNNDIHLTLMDIQMPFMNGIEATSYIRKYLKSNKPIIAVTAYGREILNGNNDFDDIILKPCTQKIITDIVEKYLK